MTVIVRRFLRGSAPAFLLLCLGMASTAAVGQRPVGTDTAVNPEAIGIQPGALPQRLAIGQQVVLNETIATRSGGQTVIDFYDRSQITVGPNMITVIDEFRYDPNSGSGSLVITAIRGVFRFIGGKLSKRDHAVTIHTPSATIEPHGGIILVDLGPEGKLDVIFAYGKSVTVTGLNGISQAITRPGFQITVPGRGASPSAPIAAPLGASAAILAHLDGRRGNTGGATIIPTDNTVASSGGTPTSSNPVVAQQTQPASPQSPVMNPVVQQSQQNLQITAVQDAVVQSVAPTPKPVVVTYAGNFKSTNGQGTSLGLLDPGGNSSVGIGYSGGTLSYPAGLPQNGVFIAMIGKSQLKIPLPFVPGFSTLPADGAGTTSPSGPVTGTTFLSSDGTFFYANLTPMNSPGQAEFIFGGQQVNPSFYAPTANNQFYALTLQPDVALQSPIPFVTNSTGGNVSNSSVSPVYVVAPANTQFGANNAKTNTNVNAPNYLQASLAINGKGANQSSVLVVSTGSFFTSSTTGTVVGSGSVRGSYFASDALVPVQTRSAASTVPDGLNNNLFGSNTITGFVLDQNSYSTTNNPVQQLATAVPLGGSAANYAFNHPGVATSVPSTISGASRTTQTLSGWFGGIMYPNIVGTGMGFPYPVAGSATVSTNATSNRLTAALSGTDPLTSSTSGINNLVVNFGSLTGDNFARSTFINDAVFAAVESPQTSSQINGTSLPTTPDGSLTPHLGLVSSATVLNSLLPNGFCTSCQFLQWGYWTGELDTPNSAGTAAVRLDAAHINTWVAGIPSVTLPARGSGTFSGNALGSVVNNGASYLASGGFTNAYNFGNQTGTFRISNFDGKTVSGTVAGRGASYMGTVSGSGLSGPVFGTFFGNLAGNPATETGGSFALQGPAYLASGIFAGKR
jgi:hypothetical protein